MIKCDDSYIPQAIEYIGDDRYQCFYLYADLLKYGVKSKNVGLWRSGGVLLMA